VINGSVVNDGVVNEHSGRRRILVACAAVGVVAAVAIVALAPSLYEVVRSGRDLVPQASGLLYEVRVLDKFTIFASEETRPDLDKLSAAGLVAAATMILTAFLLLRAGRADMRLRRCFALASAGLAFLAADELFGIHETIGVNLQFLADLPGVQRPDDALFVLYAIPLGVFAWSFRDVVRSDRRAVQLFGVGLAFFLVAVVGDLRNSGIEEPAEALAAACLLAGLVALTVSVLRRELDIDGIAARRAGPPGVATDLPDGHEAQRGAVRQAPPPPSTTRRLPDPATSKP
jgi:hypothetical protein